MAFLNAASMPSERTAVLDYFVNVNVFYSVFIEFICGNNLLAAD